MKALIFAAGLGTRLYPLTASCPKALVEVAGKPMLQHVIENIKKTGIHDVVINVHHFADQIIRFVADNNNFGLNIAISDERQKLLETGGGLLKAIPLLGESDQILIHNADILTDLDLNRIIAANNSEATLLVGQRNSSRQLVFDRSDMKLRGWVNKSTGATKPATLSIDPATDIEMSFNGIHIFSPTLFPELQRYADSIQSDAFSITPFYIHSVQHGHQISGINLNGYRWFDIGKPESLSAAQQSFSQQPTA